MPRWRWRYQKTCSWCILISIGTENREFVHLRPCFQKRIISFFLLLCLNCSTPFELHDDNYVLKAMKFAEKSRNDGTSQNIPTDGGESSSMATTYQTHPSGSSISSRPPNSSPLPGILKARVKHEQH